MLEQGHTLLVGRVKRPWRNCMGVGDGHVGKTVVEGSSSYHLGANMDLHMLMRVFWLVLTPAWPRNLRTTCPVATSHSTTVLSPPPEQRWLLSKELVGRKGKVNIHLGS